MLDKTIAFNRKMNLYFRRVRAVAILLVIVFFIKAVYAEPTPQVIESRQQTPIMATELPETVVIEEELTDEQKMILMLAKLIYHEARGESRTGQIAVAQVALNRAKWSFENLEDELFATNAFTDFQKYYNLINPDLETYETAKDAFYGKKLFGKDVLYYQNPEYATDPWMTNNCAPVMTIGNHVFYVEGK